MNSYFILTIQSKNIFAITKFIRVFIKMAEFHFNYTKKLWWTKQNKKIFTILKSPHVNKSSQEQYEINKFYKQFIVRITQKFKFLVFLKTLKANILPEVHCSVEFISNKKVSINHFITNILNPTHFLLLESNKKKIAQINTELKKKIHKTFISLFKEYLVKKNIFHKILNLLSNKLLQLNNINLKKKIKKFITKNKIILNKLMKINKKLKLKELIKKIVKSKKWVNKKLELKKINTQSKKYNIKNKIIKKFVPKNYCNKKLKLKELIKKIVKSKKLADKRWELTKINTQNKKDFKKKLLNGKIVLYSFFDSSTLKLNKKNKLKIYKMTLNNKLLNYFFTVYTYQFFNKNFIKTINSFLISLNLYGKAIKVY